MAQTFTPQVIEEEWYTKTEICWQLARLRPTKHLSRRTLDNWLQKLAEAGVKITPNECGVFELEDLKILARLTVWLNRKKTIAQFAEVLKQETANASRN